jgi:hypothetical protein
MQKRNKKYLFDNFKYFSFLTDSLISYAKDKNELPRRKQRGINKV